MAAPKIPKKIREDAELILGHLNFSTGEKSIPFYRALDEVCDFLRKKYPSEIPLWRHMSEILFCELESLSRRSAVFARDEHVRKALYFVFHHFIPAYRVWHRNLLFHQPDDAIFQPFFLAQLFETVLKSRTFEAVDLERESAVREENSLGEPDAVPRNAEENAESSPLPERVSPRTDGDLLAEADFLREVSITNEFPFDISARDEFLADAKTPYLRAVREAVYTTIDVFDDYIGYRPTPVLRTHQKMQPYEHEWSHLFPIYLKDAGAAHGEYHEIVTGALKILSETHPDLLRAASLDLSCLEELAVDPRALDFEHPVNRRLNYHFGGWDMPEVTNRGFYYRFVLIEATLKSILSRVEKAKTLKVPREELMFEASAVLAGTMLMGSAVMGWGPGAHDSSTTFATLLPQVAQLRDQFYQQLMKKVTGKHGIRLREESIRLHQPFAEARQYFNTSLARLRAAQYQNVQLARLYAWMGYTRSANEMLASVRVPSARMRCEVDCLLTLAHMRIDRKEVQGAIPMLYRLEKILCDGVRCGAFVDPWYILGFSGQYPLSQAIEDSTPDHRIDEFATRIGSIFSLYSRILKEAAAQGVMDVKISLDERMQKLTGWWDQFGSDEILESNGISGQETWESTKVVVEALEKWHEAGTATGNIAFWRPIAAEFSSAKAYVLLIEALLDQKDPVASMALLITWLSQSELIPLEDGDYSFHPLALRWMEDLWYPPTKEQRLLCRRGDKLQDRWEMAKKFIDYVESNADVYSLPPQLDVPAQKKRPSSKNKPDQEPWRLKPGEFPPAGEGLDPEISELFKELFSDDLKSGDSDADGDSDFDMDFEDPDFDMKDFSELFGEEIDEDLDLDDDEDEDDEDDDSAGGILGAAWENVTYKDTTDDGNDANMMEFGTPRDSMKDFPLTSEMERVSDRLLFFITQARLWKMAAVFSIPFASEHPTRSDSLQAWASAAQRIYDGLMVLLGQVEAFEIDEPLPTQSSLMDYEKRRSMKDSLLDRIISTSSEILDAKRLMEIADTENRITSPDTWETATQSVMQALICGEVWKIPMIWEGTLKLLLREPLLYRPLSRGGDPKRIVHTRSVQTVLQRLLYNLPQQGFLKETQQVLMLAQQMERQHPAGMRSITRFDHLFQIGCRSVVQAIMNCALKNSPARKNTSVGEAEDAENAETVSEKKSAGGKEARKRFSELENFLLNDGTIPMREGWSSEALSYLMKSLSEVLMKNWVMHSRGIRISALDSISKDHEWEDLKDFIQTYGNDLFAPTLMSYGNLQAIHHQGVRNWLQSLMEEDEPEMGLSLAEDLREGRFELDNAETFLEIVLETLLERYGEFIDYNTTTTQSDKGENLYILLDFLRIRAEYDRVAWDMFPILNIHAVMVRRNCADFANNWFSRIMDRHEQIAERFLKRYDALQKEYGVTIKSVRDRLEERFVVAKAINCLQALLEPAIMEVRAGGDTPSFRKFLQNVQVFLDHPTGTGFEPPRWLEEVEEEVQRYRNKSEDDDEMLDLKDFIPAVILSEPVVRDTIIHMATDHVDFLDPYFPVDFLNESPAREPEYNDLYEILGRLPDFERSLRNESSVLRKPNPCPEEGFLEEEVSDERNLRIKDANHLADKEFVRGKKPEKPAKKKRAPRKKADNPEEEG